MINDPGRDYTDGDIEAFVKDLDQVIFRYEGRFDSHNIAGMLLSRVTLLMTMDPAVGKHLVKYVWEKLDEIEQADPGNMI
jgi:hypothetical protein